MGDVTVMNWHYSQSLCSSLCLLHPPPQPQNPSIIPVNWCLSVRITVLWEEIHSETEMKGFLPKRAVTECLWLTPNRFSLDDSWARTGRASLPEAQRPRAGCHAQAMSLSLGHGAFLLGGATVDKSDSHDLFMLYLPRLMNLSRGGQDRKKDRGIFFFFF